MVSNRSATATSASMVARESGNTGSLCSPILPSLPFRSLPGVMSPGTLVLPLLSGRVFMSLPLLVPLFIPLLVVSFALLLGLSLFLPQAAASMSTSAQESSRAIHFRFISHSS